MPGNWNMSEDVIREWRPLAEVPQGRALHILVRTKDGAINSWRWLPYKKGSLPPYVGGRWQQATEYSFKNATLPEQGEFALNPVKKGN